MKKVSTLILALAIASTGFSQKKVIKKATISKPSAEATNNGSQKITIKELPEDIGGGVQNALVVKIPDINPVDAEEGFKTYMKSYNGKKTSKGGSVFIDNADIKEMSENTVDVYAKAVAAGKDVNFNVAFDLGGIFLSSKTHKDKYLVAEKMLKDFATKMTKEPLLAKLKEAQKISAKADDEQKNLEKENASLNEEIQNYKNKTKTAEDNLAKNKIEQDKKKVEIETNKKLVADIETKLKATE
ncbi:MAG: hypothetical protein ABI315_13925 [Bacteroidia bacterium]